MAGVHKESAPAQGRDPGAGAVQYSPGLHPDGMQGAARDKPRFLSLSLGRQALDDAQRKP